MRAESDFINNEPSNSWMSWRWEVFGAALIVGAIVATLPVFLASTISRAL